MSDFLISQAHAQSAGGGFMSGQVMSFLPFILVFAIMYFVMIRPQQNKQKELRNSLNALRRGDRVVTAGGILGTVQKNPVEGSTEIELEIAPNVRVQVLRSTITSVLTSASKPANDTDATKKVAAK